MLDFPISDNLTTVGHLMTSPLSTPKDWAGDIIQLRKLINNIAGDCNDRTDSTKDMSAERIFRTEGKFEQVIF